MFGIVLLGCQQQYAYRSKVKVNKQEIVKAKPEKGEERERERERGREGERVGEERVERGEITAGEGVHNILPFLPIIKLEFGKKENKRDSVVTEFRKEYKSLKQKFPENESSAKYSNLILFVGVALLVLSLFIGLEVGFLLALLMGLFGVFLIIFNLVKRHRIENKELIERRKKYLSTTEGAEERGLRSRRTLSILFLLLTLLSILMFFALEFAIFLFFSPMLLAAGIVGYRNDLDRKDSDLHILAIVVGALGLAFLIFLLVFLVILGAVIIYPILLLVLALVLFGIGKALSSIYLPKSY